jgi:hypothetical protein
MRARRARAATDDMRARLVTARVPADLRADPGSWLAVDAAPERDDLRAATA